MLAVDQSKKMLPPLWPTVLSLIHQSTISTHHAKEGYEYPTMRLPHTLSKLAGLPTRIYQTIHEGMLAFLIVVTPTSTASKNDTEKLENVVKDANTSAFTRRRSSVQIRPCPLFFEAFSGKERLLGVL
ncbi:MAG: hypothetical protein ACXV5F_08435 [Halobacteriota archaeon]